MDESEDTVKKSRQKYTHNATITTRYSLNQPEPQPRLLLCPDRNCLASLVLPVDLYRTKHTAPTQRPSKRHCPANANELTTMA